MKEIRDRNDPVLRQIAKEVSPKEIGTKKIKEIIRAMSESLFAQKDGVAIAAPQIGESVRIVVVSHKVFLSEEEEKNAGGRENMKDDMVLINPEIIKQSKKKLWVEEGCLSVRWLYGETYRSKKTLIRALDEDGKSFTYGGSDLLSQIFQHEVDHLNGILFIDHAKNLYELPPPKNVK